MRGRKRTNKVNMDVGKTTGGKRNGCRRGENVFVDFGSLARNTLSGPEVDIPSHPVPKETGGKQASGGPNTGMAYGVNMLEIFWRKARGIRGRKVAVEMSPRRLRVGERGTEEIRETQEPAGEE